MASLDRPTVRILFTILFFVVIGAFLFFARTALIVFVFAIFFAYVLDPAVSYLQRHSVLTKGSRSFSILVVYVALLGSIAAAIVTVGPRAAHEGQSLAAALPDLVPKVQSGQIAQQIGERHGWSYKTQIRLKRFLASHSEVILTWVSKAAAKTFGLLTNAFWIVLIPILAVFFLRDGPEFAQGLIDTMDRRRERQFMRGVLNDMNQMVAQFIRAQLTLAALSLVVYTAVLSLMQVPYGMIMGIMGGMMEFIPVIGPLVAAMMILGVAALSGFHHIIILVVFLGLWRLLQDYVNSPHIMGDRVALHPLSVLFAVLAGGEIGGVVGVYLSIPVMASLGILWRRWRTYASPLAVEPLPENWTPPSRDVA
jgi:predicted PurR-regulated permease PerM